MYKALDDGSDDLKWTQFCAKKWHAMGGLPTDLHTNSSLDEYTKLMRALQIKRLKVRVEILLYTDLQHILGIAGMTAYHIGHWGHI